MQGPISAAVKTLNKVIEDLLILLLLQASGQQANVALRRFASVLRSGKCFVEPDLCTDFGERLKV